MPRTQVQDPLPNAPGLRPTVRPLNVGGAARPAPRPQDNGIFGLAEALSEWQPALRQMIADKAAQDQEAAVTEGELKAAALSAQERMAAINGKLKTFVDDGTVSKAQLPSFQSGFSRRTGRDIALTEFQSALDEAYKSTTTVDGRADPEAVLNDTLKAFRDRLPQGDIYAAKGFDEVASQIAQNFRQRSNTEYQANYEKAAEVRIANEGVDLLQQTVLSGPDEKPAKLEAFRSYFDTLKSTELPKAQTAPFIVKNVVAPMVDDLVARGDFDGAEELVNDMEAFDVTGQGGILGNMATTKGALAQMKLDIGERRRRADDPTETYQKKVRAAYFTGEADAKVALVGLGDNKIDPATKQKLIADYREKNKDNPWAVSTFSDYLDKTEKEGSVEDVPSAVVTVNRQLNTVDLGKLGEARNTLQELARTGQISPATEFKLEEAIRKNEQLIGLYEPRFREIAAKNIYLVPDPTNSSVKSPQFKTAEAYATLTKDQQQEHENRTLDYFDNTLKELIRSKGDPLVASQELSKLMDEATNRTVVYADSVTASFQKQNEERARAKQVEAERVRQYSATPAPAFVESQRPAQPVGAKGLLALVPSRHWLPLIVYHEVLTGQAYYAPVGSVQYPDDLKSLAAIAKGDSATVAKYRVTAGPQTDVSGTGSRKVPYAPETTPQAQEKASLKYAYLKSVSGFKPDEIIKKVTEEGVDIDPAQIDYRRVPVFESMAQLEKEWNQGKPAEGGLFTQLGDLIDPSNTMTAQEFYAHQRALLSAAKK